jgi:hypothetical protein
VTHAVAIVAEPPTSEPRTADNALMIAVSIAYCPRDLTDKGYGPVLRSGL